MDQPPPRMLRWLDGPARFAAAAAEPRLLAADSFLVASGRVRGWERHWTRFSRACQDQGVDPRRVEPFRAAVANLLLADGRWFPRVDLVTGADESPEFRVRVRAAPAFAPEVIAWPMPVVDPRRAPRRKGPDLELLGEWRAQAQRSGADEALLIDDCGRVLEGAYTSLLWWEDDVLCALPDDAPILLGITRGLLLDLARAREVRVAYRRPAPSELAGCEVWLTSALHGIRRVSGWVGVDGLAGNAGRAETWRALLDAMASPVPPNASPGWGMT